MQVKVRRHSLAEALKLSVRNGRMTTILSPLGDQLTSVDLTMEVVQRSSLTVGLPEGGDLFNFGSTGVAGNDIVTGAFGMKYKPCKNTEVGVAWEAPLTDRRDVLDNRLTFDFILRY